MSSKLKDRIESYQNQSDYKLLNKLPIIFSINGKSFSKFTSLLEKPFSEGFFECIKSTLMRLCVEIDGVVFGYQFNDEIIIVARNDQSSETEAWFDNKIQKLISVSSSVASTHFNNCALSIGLNTIGDPLFLTQVFTVPNIIEAINFVIYKQQQNFYTSTQLACTYELYNKNYNKQQIKDMTHGLSIDDKILLLSQECNIDFNKYSSAFKRGIGCYKAPKIVDGIVKNKWIINEDLPIFTQDTSFLNNIFKHGTDILRNENI